MQTFFSQFFVTRFLPKLKPAVETGYPACGHAIAPPKPLQSAALFRFRL